MRTSLSGEKAKALAELLSSQRLKRGYSIRQLAANAGVPAATVLRLERGELRAPQADTLRAVAAALGLSISDVFTTADWLPKSELPSFRPYMRAKYGALPDEGVAELQAYLDQLAAKYGVTGPIDGEDEA
ncbi:MAG: helix-turn-helix domain-containing protein [Frankiaceae bacterium]|nr:helix-turn-helix domain-containing protein [Frankiaceae bacterium]